MDRRNFLTSGLGIGAAVALSPSDSHSQERRNIEQRVSDSKKEIELNAIWGEQLRPNTPNNARALANLAEAVNKYTNIQASVGKQLYLSSKEIQNKPLLIITSTGSFELTETERKNLQQYAQNGGTIFVDSMGGTGYNVDGAPLKQMIRSSIGSRFAPIPNSHQLYHCFFDFNDGPPLGSEMSIRATTMPMPVLYLEGIEINNKLAVIYSDKGYAWKWKDMSNNDAQLKMGVNLVVYSMTK